MRKQDSISSKSKHQSSRHTIACSPDLCFLLLPLNDDASPSPARASHCYAVRHHAHATHGGVDRDSSHTQPHPIPLQHAHGSSRHGSALDLRHACTRVRVWLRSVSKDVSKCDERLRLRWRRPISRSKSYISPPGLNGSRGGENPPYGRSAADDLRGSKG
jgi:hypothetical protein